MREIGMTSSTRLVYRSDGWPLCPSCGEDELGCLTTPPLTAADGWTFMEAMTWYREHEMFCHRCGCVTLKAGW